MSEVPEHRSDLQFPRLQLVANRSFQIVFATSQHTSRNWQPENEQLETETTLRTALAHATGQFSAAPELRAHAQQDALLLLLHVAGISRAAFHANPERALTPAEQSAYQDAVRRRLNHEPIQYITGEQEFYSLTLRVTPAVLIPRPETEHLVESVLQELSSSSSISNAAKERGSPAAPSDRHSLAKRRNLLLEPALRILDIGTGSGAIAIALAHHLPHALVTATDISPAALSVAAENASRHHLADRISFIESDLLSAVSPGSVFDAIVSNPPYIPDADHATLHPQVGDFEPAAALFAGLDGLAIYRRLIPQARTALAPNGLLALEIGHGQREALASLLTGWRDVRFIPDLQGIPRVALARRE